MWPSDYEQSCPTQIAESLLAELENRGLPSRDSLSAIAVKQAYGRDEGERLLKTIPPSVVPSPETVSPPAVLQALGAGRALAEFLLAPLPDDGRRSEFCDLAAIMNLALVAYDRTLDETCLSPESMKHPEIFEEFQERFRASVPDTNAHTIFGRFLGAYFEAENMTVTHPLPVPHWVWLRKNALSFVLMVLPELLATHNNLSLATDRFAYLRWVYWFGAIIGYVDDAADADQDARQQHPNIWATVAKEDKTRKRIAARFCQMLAWWDRKSSQQIPAWPERLRLKEICTVQIATWLSPFVVEA